MKKSTKRRKGLKSAGLSRLSKKTRLLLVTFFAVGASLAAYSAFAAVGPTGGPAFKPSTSGSSSSSSSSGAGPICNKDLSCESSSSSTSSGGIAPATTTTTDTTPQNNATKCSENLKDNCIVKDIQMVVNFLSAGVAIIVIGSIIWGGVQYIMAGNKPEAVAAARQRISNSMIALGVFLVIYGFLQWLIPGGIFG